jgi:creatinine amidohydrolase
MRLAHIPWPQIESVRSGVCVIPLGSIEQHGLHLPLWTDTAIVSEIAARLEQRMPEQVVLAPTQPVGFSPHHARFGCMSIDLAAYMALVRSLCRSVARMGFSSIFLLNGHGGNEAPCRAAMCELKVELPDLRVIFASYWSLSAAAFQRIRSSGAGGMGHACEMETSIMLALHPVQVRLSDAGDDGPVVRAREGQRIPDMLQGTPYYIVRNLDEISSNGTIGCPSEASTEKGRQFLDAAVDACCALVSAFVAGELEFPRAPAEK